jgi:hypothetical protein
LRRQSRALIFGGSGEKVPLVFLLILLESTSERFLSCWFIEHLFRRHVALAFRLPLVPVRDLP